MNTGSSPDIMSLYICLFFWSKLCSNKNIMHSSCHTFWCSSFSTMFCPFKSLVGGAFFSSTWILNEIQMSCLYILTFFFAEDFFPTKLFLSAYSFFLQCFALSSHLSVVHSFQPHEFSNPDIVSLYNGFLLLSRLFFPTQIIWHCSLFCPFKSIVGDAFFSSTWILDQAPFTALCGFYWFITVQSCQSLFKYSTSQYSKRTWLLQTCKKVCLYEENFKSCSAF